MQIKLFNFNNYISIIAFLSYFCVLFVSYFLELLEGYSRVIRGSFSRPYRDHIVTITYVTVPFVSRLFPLQRYYFILNYANKKCRLSLKPALLMFFSYGRRVYNPSKISCSNCLTVIIRQSPIVSISNKSLSPDTRYIAFDCIANSNK